MALTAAEKTTLAALIVREGGLAAFAQQVQAGFIAAAQASALTALTPAIAVTVTDWAALRAYVAQSNSSALFAIMAAINAAVVAGDAAPLGPLLIQLLGAVKNRYSL